MNGETLSPQAVRGTRQAPEAKVQIQLNGFIVQLYILCRTIVHFEPRFRFVLHCGGWDRLGAQFGLDTLTLGLDGGHINFPSAGTVSTQAGHSEV